MTIGTPLEEGETTNLVLPKPRTAGSALADLLHRRRSVRSFSERAIDAQTLADLLWCAFGRSTLDGYRTAPSARNWREIDIYAALKQGLFRFDPHTESLEQMSRDDIRSRTGQQDYVASAPVNLVYVADFEKMGGASPRERELYAAADAGVICQNVYLFCTERGLGTVVRGLIDRSELARVMRLRPNQQIMLAQSVGFAAV